MIPKAAISAQSSRIVSMLPMTGNRVSNVGEDRFDSYRDHSTITAFALSCMSFRAAFPVSPPAHPTDFGRMHLPPTGWRKPRAHVGISSWLIILAACAFLLSRMLLYHSSPIINKNTVIVPKRSCPQSHCCHCGFQNAGLCGR